MASKNILVLCTSNSIRSQIAEAFFRKYGSDKINVLSGGIMPSYVHPLAIAMMNELSIDISQQTSKDLREFLDCHFDYVITLSETVKEHCPKFPNNTIYLHWDIPDPTAFRGGDKDMLNTFREVRSTIEENVQNFLNDNGLK
ncbi:arsenate reductase ArsC [candidate division KSB1 bacterium]